jgi:transcriptional regulator with XRE-family HTH domain
MIDRISLILRTKNINASQFADEIGVQRSSISHVLSGRNKPSLEFVQRILKRYPEINPDWLLFGKGAMHQESNLFSDMDETIDVKAEAISKALGRSDRGISPLVPKSKLRPVKPLLKEAEPDDIEEPEDYTEEEVQAEAVKPPLNQPSVVQESPVAAAPAPTPVQEKREAVIPPLSPKEIDKIVVLYKDRSFREYSPE